VPLGHDEPSWAKRVHNCLPDNSFGHMIFLEDSIHPRFGGEPKGAIRLRSEEEGSSSNFRFGFVEVGSTYESGFEA